MIKSLYTLAFVLFAIITCNAQCSVKTYTDSIGEYYEFVDDPPQFKGGNDSLYSYISKKLEYPSCIGHVQGKTFISFIVEKDGNLTNIKVLKSASEALDNAALEVFREMPDWIPGKCEEEIVRCLYIIPFGWTFY